MKSRKRSSGLLPVGMLLAVLAGCSSAPVATPATELAQSQVQARVMPGNWQVIAVDSDVEALADYAAATLSDARRDPLSRVVQVKSQQVTGTNYAMVLEFASGKRWQVGLYRDLDGMLQITHSRRL